MARLTYKDALARIGQALQFGINPSLEPVRDICARLGDPQKCYRVTQVAGTNGKTSVARMTAAILTAHGLVTGHYLSPHLEEYTERFVVDGEDIAPERFAAALEAVLPAAEAVEAQRGQPLTEFELLTAMAFRYFADEGCDVAVLEVGLGGRWDATTVADPDVAVITSIALDHTDRLGVTEAEIAREKAEIVKPGRRLIVGRVGDEAWRVIAAKAEGAGVPVRRLGADVTVEPAEAARGEMGLSVVTPGGGRYADLALATDAPYQRENAALATAAAEWLLDANASGGEGAGCAPSGVARRSGRAERDGSSANRVSAPSLRGERALSEEHARPPHRLDPALVRSALAQLDFPGRMERLSDAPTLIIDGAHNPDAARRLAEALTGVLDRGRIVFALGIMADKDVAGIVGALAPLADRVICTRNSSPRCLPPEKLAELVRAAGAQAEVVDPLPEACERAIELAGEDGAVVVTGSLYTAGEARIWWRAART